MDPIITTLVAYKLLLLGIGWAASRKTHDEEDFYLGGRKLGPLVAAISASASSSSGWTLLGVSGAAFAWGLGAIWLIPGCVGGFILNWCFIAPRLRAQSRESGALTLPSFIAQARGGHRRSAFMLIASGLILVALGIYVGQQFNAAGKTFEESLDLDATTSVLIGAAVVVAYTLLGGFLAVSLTDTLQGLVMALTAIAVPIAGVMEVGGLDALWATLIEADGERGIFRGMAPAGAAGFVLGLLGIGMGYPGQPHVVNRFMALRGEATEMAQARRFAITWAVVVYSGMIITGWCGHVLMSELGDKDKVLVAMTEHLFPPVLAGIMLAAILSAVMSTADSLLLVGGSTIAHDLGFADGDPARRVLISRLVILGLSLGGVALALYGDRDIFKMTLFAFGLLGAGFGPLLMAHLVRGPSAPSTRLATIVAATLATVIAQTMEGRTTFGVLVVPFVIACAIAFCGPRDRSSN